jgi:UDP-N-acetylmuramoyl-L-alanyl-D-glutamate--2,6-diaminopimelate ligase
MTWWKSVAGCRAIGELPSVRSITHDSRRVLAGVAFVAIPGAARDGHDYLDAAVEAGAPALVVQVDREAAWAPFRGRVPLLVAPDTRAALGRLAAAIHGDPSARLRLIGVTGTDGKTTTTHLTSHVLDACGLACGYLSSVGFQVGDGFELNATHMTTVESTVIQDLLARALAGGRRSMAVEASSEGLAQHRLNGCLFDAAIFTNLSRDHLDFHGTMENYLAAKGRLFEMLAEWSDKTFPRAAVLNLDDPASAYLRSRTRAPVLTYGEGPACDYRVADIRPAGAAIEFVIEHDGVASAARLPLIGRFNALNATAAVATAASQGVGLQSAVEALAGFGGIPGRLERIDCGQPFHVYVDIASTPAALENVLQALRPVAPGRLWVVFGAAGGRDPARRHGMGLVAGRLADRAILTNEDPRDEDPGSIIEAIAAGLREAGRAEGSDFLRVPDRREAITRAFALAGAGDLVLLAGKATETTIVAGGSAIPWDERALARELLGRAIAGADGQA